MKPLGKSVAGAVLRSWVLPGWGQGYVHGAGLGWAVAFLTVAALLALAIAGAHHAAWLLGVPAIAFGQLVHAGMTAARWNRRNGRRLGQAGHVAGFVIAGCAVLVATSVLLSGIVFVVASNLATDLDYSQLTPPATSTILANADDGLVSAGRFAYNFTLDATRNVTFAFVSDDVVPLDACLAAAGVQGAFDAGTAQCAAALDDRVQGKRTITLPAGSYVLLLRTNDGGDARITYSLWHAAP